MIWALIAAALAAGSPANLYCDQRTRCTEVPGTNLSSLYGPAPTGCAANDLPSVSLAVGDAIMPNREASRSGRPADGLDNANTTLSVPFAEMPLSPGTSWLPSARHWLMLLTTAAASSGV